MSDPALVECPKCTQPALKRKIGTGAGFIFKGGGFYETDFKDKKGTDPDKKPTSKEEKTSESTAKPESPKAETPATVTKKDE